MWVQSSKSNVVARCLGFTEEFIDEMKETLAGSNLHLLVLTALVTAVQVRVTHPLHKVEVKGVLHFSPTVCLNLTPLL